MPKLPKIRSAYDGSRVRVALECGPGRTKQAMKDECDINRILTRYAKSGVLTHMSKRQGTFMDVSHAMDYRAAIEHVRDAEAFFATLPAAVRARFDNDAAAFLDFASDPGNRAELDELGVEPQLEEAPDTEEPPAVAAEGS